ncbi:hypothetical protein CB599_11710 [Salmonella enterica subsp. enterica serovar Adjame]|nr:hypothetical protein [Salmonella enterica subsp. enterica serovar Adjame]
MLDRLARCFAADVTLLMLQRGHTEQEAVSLLEEVDPVEHDANCFALVHNNSGLVATFNAVEMADLAVENSAAIERLDLCACALVGAYELRGNRYAEQN